MLTRYLHRRRITYPADVLKARDAQIWEELKVFADGFATQLVRRCKLHPTPRRVFVEGRR